MNSNQRARMSAGELWTLRWGKGDADARIRREDRSVSYPTIRLKIPVAPPSPRFDNNSCVPATAAGDIFLADTRNTHACSFSLALRGSREVLYFRCRSPSQPPSGAGKTTRPAYRGCSAFPGKGPLRVGSSIHHQVITCVKNPSPIGGCKLPFTYPR